MLFVNKDLRDYAQQINFFMRQSAKAYLEDPFKHL